tara:strand:- start:2842 stop:4950 length:2109 start_codon:yes stop_codon:yes gene_type:complete
LSRITQYQSNFTAGEIDPLLVGRVDIQQYASAVSKATNVVMLPQGGFERRPGSKFLLNLTDHLGPFTPLEGIRLIPFEFSTTQSFMLLFVKNTTTSTRMFVFANGKLIYNINNLGASSNYVSHGFGDIDLNRLYYTQSADTLILVHEDMTPKKLVRGASNNLWYFQNSTQSTFNNGNPLIVPKVAFTLSTSSPAGTITPDAIDGTVTITASSGVFTTAHVDQYINVLSGFGRAKIIERQSATVVKAITEVPFFKADQAIANGLWELEEGYEDAWSSTRGYPRTCTFHESRLYFGGSKSLPNTLFGSKIADFFNFKSAEALDDDAILVTMSTDSVNAITAMRSGRDLQIFTKDAEFFVPQASLEPITPSNIVIKNATRRGSKEGIKPVMAEGGTLFIQREGKALREFLFSDVDLNYQANNISLLASHLLKTPRSMALRVATSTDDGDLLLIPNDEDGSMAVFSILRSQNVVAPAEWITDGKYLDVAVDVSNIYTVVERNYQYGLNTNTPKYYLEIFDDQRTTDSSIQYYSGGQANFPDQDLPSEDGLTTELLLLGHLKNVVCNVIRDGAVLANATPQDLLSVVGINIDVTPSTFAEVGVPYSVQVDTLPAEPKLSSGVVISRKRRILEVTTLVDRTQNLAVNGVELPFGTLPYVLGSTPPTFTGRKRIAPFLGYSDTANLTFTMTQPLFATVLSVEYKLSTGQ